MSGKRPQAPRSKVASRVLASFAVTVVAFAVTVGLSVYAQRRAALDQEELTRGFVPAALVLTRVVSKPGPGRLCLDLGHKAIAAENPHPRVFLPTLPDARAVIQSEEHLVVEAAYADAIPVGAALYGLPLHICPTVALYAEAVVVNDGRAEGRWPVAARARKLTI